MSTSVTILGCGVAGSWAAQHLACIGYDDFVLFGGDADRPHVLTNGPFPPLEKGVGMASKTLASLLTRINPAINLDVREDFDPAEGVNGFKGGIVGTMGSMKYCMAAYRLAKENNIPWISLCLPSTASGTVLVTSDPYEIDPDEHLGQTILSRSEIMLASARFATQADSLFRASAASR